MQKTMYSWCFFVFLCSRYGGQCTYPCTLEVHEHLVRRIILIVIMTVGIFEPRFSPLRRFGITCHQPQIQTYFFEGEICNSGGNISRFRGGREGGEEFVSLNHSQTKSIKYSESKAFWCSVKSSPPATSWTHNCFSFHIWVFRTHESHWSRVWRTS